MERAITPKKSESKPAKDAEVKQMLQLILSIL